MLLYTRFIVNNLSMIDGFSVLRNKYVTGIVYVLKMILFHVIIELLEIQE